MNTRKFNIEVLQDRIILHFGEDTCDGLKSIEDADEELKGAAMLIEAPLDEVEAEYERILKMNDDIVYQAMNIMTLT